jgi:Family of unknown function (DUF6232)
MSAELSPRPEIYFYRHNGTTITSRYFTTPSGRYLIRDLKRFARSQREAESGLKVGLITAAVELVIVLPALTIVEPSVAFALIVPALVIPFLVAFAYGKRHPAEFELLALYRGYQVILFATSDQQQFGQVARALLRAAEAAHG